MPEATQGRRVERAERLLKRAGLLAPRLARLAPDSIWARRAAGRRRGLLRLIRRVERGLARGRVRLQDLEGLEAALEEGFRLLERSVKR